MYLRHLYIINLSFISSKCFKEKIATSNRYTPIVWFSSVSEKLKCGENWTSTLANILSEFGLDWYVATQSKVFLKHFVFCPFLLIPNLKSDIVQILMAYYYTPATYLCVCHYTVSLVLIYNEIFPAGAWAKSVVYRLVLQLSLWFTDLFCFGFNCQAFFFPNTLLWEILTHKITISLMKKLPSPMKYLIRMIGAPWSTFEECSCSLSSLYYYIKFELIRYQILLMN